MSEVSRPQAPRCGPVAGCGPEGASQPEGTIHINAFPDMIPGTPKSDRVDVYFKGDSFGGAAPTRMRFADQPSNLIPLRSVTMPGGGPGGALGGRRFFTGQLSGKRFERAGDFPAEVQVNGKWQDVCLKVSISS